VTADGPAEGVTPGPETAALGRSGFAHASEAEMSRILDFYGVTWNYEPTTFPILWNLDGEVVESFSPDFYLPEFDLYLEMTTLKQSLVRKKNRKLRRLRELYPDIRIKLFYARDFRAMMLKYGRLGLAESLSGTSGQLVGGELASEATRSPSAAVADADGSGVAPARSDEPSSVEATNLDGPNPTAAKRRRRARRHGRGGARTDLTISRHVADA
jgi:hypoxanthine phosphoribosyltransferase